MIIAMGSDHAGYNLKEEIKAYLLEKGNTVKDCGTDSTESCDYPVFGRAAAEVVREEEAERAIVICGSGIGISIAANKVPGIRCALCSEPLSAELSRRHNNANALAMGARLIGSDMAKRIVDVFLSTEFEGGRHQKRVDKINKLENNH